MRAASPVQCVCVCCRVHDLRCLTLSSLVADGRAEYKTLVRPAGAFEAAANAAAVRLYESRSVCFCVSLSVSLSLFRSRHSEPVAAASCVISDGMSGCGRARWGCHTQKYAVSGLHHKSSHTHSYSHTHTHTHTYTHTHTRTHARTHVRTHSMSV